MPLRTGSNRQLYDLEARDLKLIGHGLRRHFDPADWQRAGLEGREQMAQVAHDYIRERYDLAPQPLHLARDWPEGLHGDFDPLHKQVTVNAGLLRRDDPTSLLNTLAHENRHGVQQERIEGNQPVPYEDRIGRTEVDAWAVDGQKYNRDVFVQYHYNTLEVDAREAASSVVNEGFWAEHRRLLDERVAEASQ